MEGLARPGLYAGKVEEREARGGAGPDGISEADAGEADKAGRVGPAPASGGGEEGDEIGEGGGGEGFARGVEVGGKNGGLDGGGTAAGLGGSDGGVAVAGGGGIIIFVVGVGYEIGGRAWSGGGSGHRRLISVASTN